MEAAHQHLIEGAAEEATAIETQIKVAKADGREAMWRLAEALYAFHQLRGWAKLGHDTLEEWLAQADVGLKSRSYFNYVRSWEKLVIHRKVQPERLREIEPSKVVEVLPKIVSHEVPIDDALADAEVLGFRDLRTKYRPAKAEPKADQDGEDMQAPAYSDQSGEDQDGEDADPAVDLDTTPQAPIGPDSEPQEAEEAAQTVEDAVAEEQAPEANGVAEEPQEAPQEDDLKPITELDGPEAPTDPMTLDAMKAEGETLGWDELRNAIGSGAAYPRMKRMTMMELLAWAEKWELA